MHLRDSLHLSLRICFVRDWCCISGLFCLIVLLRAQCASTRVRGSERGPIPALFCLIMRPIYWIIIGSISGPAVNYCPHFIMKDASAVKVTSFSDTCRDAWLYSVVVVFCCCVKTNLLFMIRNDRCVIYYYFDASLTCKKKCLDHMLHMGKYLNPINL